MKGPESSGGFSEDRDAGADAGADGGGPTPFSEGDRARYEPLELAGRGGMGEVVVARDRRLGREVALKRVAAGEDHDAASARFVREAWVTARLEHPSIVPVYDVGRDDEGRLFYTMRLIHGRSLEGALFELQGTPARGKARTSGGLGPERRPLLRHFLAACEAVAYAHSHGITHRDLKPANIMVGAFGETQVVDWGLAGFTSEVTARAFASEHSAASVTTRSGLGTPAYMSPEQARGEPVSAGDDVWALGAILFELTCGERLLAARGEEALERALAGDVDRSRLAAAPAELAAIVEKATARDPAARYRDAGDLAADLARYLDGRRVEAHSYTTLELAERLARRLRVPLAAAAGGILAASIALALTFRTIASERERALQAEAGTRAALAISRETSAFALARQAVTELGRGALPEAEILASQALLHGESTDARGVVAATSAGARPRAAESTALPGCERVVPGSRELALCLGDREVAVFELSPLRERWRAPLSARILALAAPPAGAARAMVIALGGATDVYIFDARTGALAARLDVAATTGVLDQLAIARDGLEVAVSEGRLLTRISLETLRVSPAVRPCVAAPIGAIAPAPGGFVVTCEDGAIVEVRGPEVSPLFSVPALGQIGVRHAALDPAGRVLVAGGTSGDLVSVELETRVVSQPVRVLDEPVSRLAVLAGGERVLLGGEAAGVRLCDLAARSELLRLPVPIGLGLELTPEGVLTGGLRAARWDLPESLPPGRFELPAGLSAIALSPDGALLAAGRSDGRVTVLERRTGRVVADLTLGTEVVKAVDFSTDGRRLAASISRPLASPRAFSVGTWAVLPFDEVRRPARRLIHDAAGRLIAAHYGSPALSVWTSDGARSEVVGPEIFDVTATRGRAEVLVVSTEGRVYRLQGLTLVPDGRDVDYNVIAAFPDGERIATGHTTGVLIRDRAGATRFISNGPSRLTDLAISPDQRYVAGARVDGTVGLWSSEDGRLIATLRGHRLHAAHLVFDDAGTLFSAGWDGRILAWELPALDRPAAELAASAERSWAADLELVLRPAIR